MGLHISARYPKDHNQFGALSGIPDLASSLEGKLIEERETLYAQLKETYGKLVSIESSDPMVAKKGHSNQESDND